MGRSITQNIRASGHNSLFLVRQQYIPLWMVEDKKYTHIQ